MSWSGYRRGDLLAIAIGGVAGATVRWFITQMPARMYWFADAPNTSGAGLSQEPAIPGATLVVNLIGCLLLGGLTLLARRPMKSGQRRVLVGAATGFCGSLTTFSSFAVEVADLLRGSPHTSSATSWALGGAYIALSLIGGAFAFWLGRLVTQRIATQPQGGAIGGRE